jgi:hypothetical protein
MLLLLNCPFHCIILGEVFFDGKCGFQDELPGLDRGPGYHGLGPRGPRNRNLASRNAGNWLGNSIEHLVGTSKNKGLKTLLKSNPTPSKNERNPTQTMKVTIRGWTVLFE